MEASNEVGGTSVSASASEKKVVDGREKHIGDGDGDGHDVEGDGWGTNDETDHGCGG